jgi:hypothetical protein
VKTTIRHQLIALFACLPATALAAEQAGVSAAVRGEVVLARAQAVGTTVRSGEAIFLQDKLKSGPRSGMQILLLDETTFTIGADSELVVDEFVYDPATSAGKLSARVAKGVFRFVSGRIAKEEPSNMNVGLPSGTIGVRGTMAAGSVDDRTRASLIVLLGEGPDNVTGAPPGSIDVCNAGACTHVARAGFGVRIDGPESRPSPAFQVDPDAIHAIVDAVTNPEDATPTAVADGRDRDVVPDGTPGDREADAIHRAKEVRRVLASLDESDFFTDLAAQDAQTDDLQQLADRNLARIPDGPTLYDQLRSIPNGQIHYFQTGVALSGGGSYDLLVDVDFGAQTYAGGSSYFQVNGSRNGFQQLNVPQSYAGQSGNAGFLFSTSAITGAGCGTNCTAQLGVFPQNSGGVIAGRALHNIVVKDNLGVPIDSGSGNAPALPGP